MQAEWGSGKMVFPPKDAIFRCGSQTPLQGCSSLANSSLGQGGACVHKGGPGLWACCITPKQWVGLAASVLHPNP